MENDGLVIKIKFEKIFSFKLLKFTLKHQKGFQNEHDKMFKLSRIFIRNKWYKQNIIFVSTI